MKRFKHHKKGGYHDDSDDVSELSHDDSSVQSNMSKSSAFRNFGHFGRRKKNARSDGTASVGSASKNSRKYHTQTSGAASVGHPRSGGTLAAPSRSTPQREKGSAQRSTASVSSAPSRVHNAGDHVDKKRLTKDAKSRFNIGLVYLKTGDYVKAQENLEHSLFCHIQMAGHDSNLYGNDTIFDIAGVREKLGDCYVANTSIVEKQLAFDHYEEARRLLGSVHPEDAPPNLTEMLQRVKEKLKQPELQNRVAGKVPPRPSNNRQTFKYQQEGNQKAKALLGVGVVGANDTPPAATAGTANAMADAGTGRNTIIGKGKIFGKIQEFAHDVVAEISDVVDDIKEFVDDSSDDGSRSRKPSRVENDKFEVAIAHLERDNHRTALNQLTSLQEGDSMKNGNFRSQLADSMLKVAISAYEAGKISVATDAYEEAYAVQKQDDSGGENTQLAMKGCIRCHKLMAMEMEGIRSYGSAISHRSRVYQLLDEDGRTIPACEQQIRIAHLHATREDYAKSAVALSEAIRRLHRGVKKDDLPSDRRDVLIQCLQMQAICYAKSKKWNDALEQYNEILPLVAKKDGQGSKDYNSVLIHKSALLVSMGNHRLAAASVDKYLKLAEFADPDLIVDSSDHVLALDTCAATQLKLGNVDNAISIFERKLKFVNTLPDNAGMKSDTMHKLGCLLANKNQPKKALPLLDEALSTRKFVYDGKHKSVLETTWAVAATNQTLGRNDKALEKYSALLEKMANVEGMPVDIVIVHNSAGKLFYEDGKVDKAVQSFREALLGVEASGNLQLKSEITLNLANALSARGEADKAMEFYGELLNTRSLKKTKISFLTRFNKGLLLIKMGEVEKAKKILNKLAENRSSMANDVKGSIFLTLGNLSVTDGNIDEALEYFQKSLQATDDDNFSAQVDAKRSIALAHSEAGQPEKAILILEELLEDLSHSAGGKSVNLLTAEIWNCMAHVYKQMDELQQAKNFAKLALQTYKAELGETNPITLRNVSNLQLFLLEEAEDLEKAEAKPIIEAAKFELEEALEAFRSLNDPWAYRLDVASLQTNLGFVALWQGKPKKARKLMRQVKEIELPPEHPLEQRIIVLEERVEELMGKK